MTNNDILRRVRYILDLDDDKMMAVFGLAGPAVTREQVCGWLKKDDDPALLKCSDAQLAIFLNGLITHRRGKKEGPQPTPEKRLNNNMIFTKLKIAFDLKAETILRILDLADMIISPHELSALFRKPGHKHFRECKDQVLRRFLKGLQIKYRKTSPAAEAVPETVSRAEVDVVPEAVPETESETEVEVVPESVLEGGPEAVPEAISEDISEDMPETDKTSL